MLKRQIEDVFVAFRDGRFHIYAVGTINDGVET